MTNQYIYYISNPQGSIHAGGGNQNVSLESDTIGARRDPRAHAIDDIAEFKRRFIYPAGFRQAAHILETHRTVLLAGAPGSGRTTAAKVLLYEHSDGTERFHELLWEDDEEVKKGKPRLNPQHIDENDRMWLDLSQAPAAAWRDFQNDFLPLRKIVLDHAAYLAVVLPDGPAEALKAEYDRYRADIARPPGMQVLRRHLAIARVPGAATSPETQSLTAFLRDDPSVERIVHFAHLVVQARTRASGAGDFTDWYETAFQALHGRGDEAAESVARLRGKGRRRALLLAAAMLDGARADHVHRAAETLLDVLSHRRDDEPILKQADLVERFRGIGTPPDTDGHVRFKELGYAAAIRTHFWRNMPELRKGIATWVGEVIGLASLPEHDLEAFVGRFAELCLQSEYQELLAFSVYRWTKAHTAPHPLLAARRALREGLTSEQHGRYFRRRINEWSQLSDLPDGLARVIIVMCLEVIAINHPDEAVVRLHHRARREQGTAEARVALLRLIQSDPRLLRLMLWRLTRLSQRWTADSGLFLDLMDARTFVEAEHRARPLIAHGEVRTMLADGWRRAFRDRTYIEWRIRAAQWLSVSFHDERHRETLIGILLDGSDTRNDVLGRLYTIAQDMPLSDGDGRERHRAFLDLVMHKITRTQGLVFTGTEQ